MSISTLILPSSVYFQIHGRCVPVTTTSTSPHSQITLLAPTPHGGPQYSICLFDFSFTIPFFVSPVNDHIFFFLNLFLKSLFHNFCYQTFFFPVFLQWTFSFHFEFLFSNNVSKYVSFQKKSQSLFPKFFNTKFLCFLDLCSQFFASKFYALFILNLIFFAAIFLISILFVKKILQLFLFILFCYTNFLPI